MRFNGSAKSKTRPLPQIPALRQEVDVTTPVEALNVVVTKPVYSAIYKECGRRCHVGILCVHLEYVSRYINLRHLGIPTYISALKCPSAV
jgi:hypothetical protein